MTDRPWHANRQECPYPEALAELVRGCELDPGWSVRLEDELDRGQGSRGLTLVIRILGFNSYHPERGQTYEVQHFFIVPAAAYDRRSWQAWLFAQYQLVRSHEGCEFFQIDGERPYAPSHGFGQDPYLIRELGTLEDQRTSFRNKVRDR